MSSEIESNDGAIYVGKPAWHGLGEVFDPQNPPTLDEAIQKVAPWEPVTGTAYAFHPSKLNENLQPILVPFEDTKIIGRVLDDGTFHKFGVVSDNYGILKNRDLFESFQELIEGGLGRIESALTMRNGAKIAVCVQLPGSLNIRGDEVKKYAICANGHDGQIKASVILTCVRLECANTLRLASNKGNKNNKVIGVRHTKNVLENVRSVVGLIDAVNAQFLATEEQFNAFAGKAINQKDLKTYVKVVYNLQDSIEKAFAEAEKKEDTRESKLVEKIAHNFVSGPGNKGQSLWDLYNAVTQHLTHERGRSGPDERMHDLLFLNAAKISDRALAAGNLLLTR